MDTLKKIGRAAVFVAIAVPVGAFWLVGQGFSAAGRGISRLIWGQGGGL